MTVGTADVTKDISLATESKPTESGGLSADLQFLPNNATTLCLNFTVVDDDLIESIESFQGSLQPTLTVFDNTVIDNTAVYIADNDGKL